MFIYGDSPITDYNLQKKGMFVKYQKKTIDGNAKIHTHMGYEVYLFHKGNVKLIIGNQVYSPKGGDMIFIPGDTPHIPRPSQSAPYIRSVINFLDSSLEMFPHQIDTIISELFPSDGKIIHWDVSEQYEIERLISKMESELNKDEFCSDTLASITLFDLLVKAYRKTLSDKKEIRHLSQREMYVERILSVINHNINEDINLDFISFHVHMNKHYMCHSFKQVTGYTISDYIQNKRIEEAKKLLLSNKSITSIGQQVGIRNVSHFSKLFKKYTGMSPSNYRNKYYSESEN
ncbi:AraC family transcriptional regulator [Neobacillus sp. Marseille-QA0830]